VRYKNDNVYIFTNKADPSVTVHRYIVRMKGGSFPYSSRDSDFYPAGSTFIEASDVTALSDGTTWSKHYNGGLYGRVKDCM
jgi:rhamnogalacturonan endolyase